MSKNLGPNSWKYFAPMYPLAQDMSEICARPLPRVYAIFLFAIEYSAKAQPPQLTTTGAPPPVVGAIPRHAANCFHTTTHPYVGVIPVNAVGCKARSPSMRWTGHMRSHFLMFVPVAPDGWCIDDALGLSCRAQDSSILYYIMLRYIVLYYTTLYVTLVYVII